MGSRCRVIGVKSLLPRGLSGRTPVGGHTARVFLVRILKSQLPGARHIFQVLRREALPGERGAHMVLQMVPPFQRKKQEHMGRRQEGESSRAADCPVSARQAPGRPHRGPSLRRALSTCSLSATVPGVWGPHPEPLSLALWSPSTGPGLQEQQASSHSLGGKGSHPI